MSPSTKFLKKMPRGRLACFWHFDRNRPDSKTIQNPHPMSRLPSPSPELDRSSHSSLPFHLAITPALLTCAPAADIHFFHVDCTDFPGPSSQDPFEPVYFHSSFPTSRFTLALPSLFFHYKYSIQPHSDCFDSCIF